MVSLYKALTNTNFLAESHGAYLFFPPSRVVMEYLDGGEVNWRNHDNEPILKVEQSRRIIRDAVLGLEYRAFGFFYIITFVGLGLISKNVAMQSIIKESFIGTSNLPTFCGLRTAVTSRLPTLVFLISLMRSGSPLLEKIGSRILRTPFSSMILISQEGQAHPHFLPQRLSTNIHMMRSQCRPAHRSLPTRIRHNLQPKSSQLLSASVPRSQKPLTCGRLVLLFTAFSLARRLS